MIALLLTAAAPVHAFIVLIVVLLVAIVLIGFVYVAASHFLPPPWPNMLVGVLVLVVVLWLLLWVAG